MASHTFIFAADDGTDKITDFSVDESEATDLTDFSDIMTFDNVSLTDEDSDMVVDLSLHGGGSVRLWT